MDDEADCAAVGEQIEGICWTKVRVIFSLFSQFDFLHDSNMNYFEIIGILGGRPSIFAFVIHVVLVGETRLRPWAS